MIRRTPNNSHLQLSQVTCSVGLILFIYANCEISLDGDGGFKCKSHQSTHIFKPVSIQAMWSAYQYLHKSFENARKNNFYSISTNSSSPLTISSNLTPNELTNGYYMGNQTVASEFSNLSANHEWVKHYSSLISKKIKTKFKQSRIGSGTHNI
jgi:hypothetical protein